MKTAVIESLASYFTSSQVAEHSMGLSLAGARNTRAVLFFTARSALGISGYMDKDEAVSAIVRILETPE